MFDDRDDRDNRSGAPSDAIASTVAQLRAQADALEAQYLPPSKKSARAPGVHTSMKPVVPPTPPPPPPSPTSKRLDMKDRVELVLYRESATYAGIAKATNEPLAKIKECVDKLYNEGWVGRVTGYDADTVWAWCLRPGDDSSERQKRVRKLMSERPLAHADIVRALGKHADDVKVNNDIIELRRHENVWDYSGGQRHAKIYFLPPDDKEPPPGMDARLKPKNSTRRKGQK